MRTITLSQFSVVPLCLQPVSPATASPSDWIVIIDGKEYALSGDLITRAANLSVDALRSGGLVLLGLHENDVTLFAPAGFDGVWAQYYRALLERMFGEQRTRMEATHEASVVRFMSGERTRADEAREALREVAQLAHAGGVREGLEYLAADLQSIGGLRNALWETAAKLRVPVFRAALEKRGLTVARMDRIPWLCDELLKEQAEELVAQGREAGAGDELTAWKAMALGDLTMLSNTARALLPQDRWEPYQIGRLLGLGRPGERREEPAAPVPPAGSGTTPVTTTTPATRPAATVATTVATTTAPTAPIPAPVSATPAGTPHLLPGTVLHTAAGADGAPWVLLVGPDGTPRWMPTAAPPPTVVAQPVVVPPGPPVASAPQPSPAKRTRRR